VRHLLSVPHDIKPWIRQNGHPVQATSAHRDS
jgi:hypothetical protein